MPYLENLQLENQRVLVRVDFNVPFDKEGKISDYSRIEAVLPTLHILLEAKAKVILMSHRGRPKGEKNAEMSLAPVANGLSEVIGREVKFASDCVGAVAEKAVSELQAGDILLLENLRFYAEEEKGEREFAAKLAKLGDVYVNDAFGTAHRAHASTAVIAEFFEHKAFGECMRSEVESVNKVLYNSEKPTVAIVGGAKVSSKITILKNLLPQVDHIIIGGGMAYTFAKAKGGDIGNSLVEEDYLDLANEILQEAKSNGVEIHLPIDSVNADAFSNDAQINISSIMSVPQGFMGLDIGPKSIKHFHNVLSFSRTILWNGPMGVFEMSNFANGTREIGEAVAEATEKGAFSLVGGGDSVAAVKQFDLDDRVSYVSTGGGAMLEYLEGKVLPGIAAMG
ncbi:MAG: phosphoglycerate kinase [Flavobacteriales bacterium]|nr:MAG: phosphoglycerate kinase [Flavobacteriales bacterium]